MQIRQLFERNRPVNLRQAELEIAPPDSPAWYAGKNKHFAEMGSGSQEDPYLRLTDFLSLNARLERNQKEEEEEDEVAGLRRAARPCMEDCVNDRMKLRE